MIFADRLGRFLPEQRPARFGLRLNLKWKRLVFLCHIRYTAGRTCPPHPKEPVMPLGIKPTVDFAFKKIFGSPECVLALIGLLNAVLELSDPIVEV